MTLRPTPHEQHVIAAGLGAWSIGRSYSTEIARSPVTGAESRHGRAGSPVLSVPVSRMADRFRNNAAGYGLLVSDAMQACRERPPRVEIWPDMRWLRAESSGTFVSCDPSLARFVAGGWCRLIDWGHRPGVGRVEDASIAEVRADGIVLNFALAGTYPSSSIVLPLVDVHSVTSAGGQNFGCDAGTLTLRASTKILETSPPPVVTPGTLPPGFPVFSGLPVLVDWATTESRRGWTVNREGELFPIGLGFVPDLEGPRARWGSRLTLVGRSRSESWRLLGFFDSRGGANFPFFLPDYAEPLHVEDARSAVLAGDPSGAPESPAQIDVASSFSVDRWGPEDVTDQPDGTMPGERRWVAMRLAGGAYSFARVISSIRVGSVDRLTLDPDPGSIDDLQAAWPMRMVRGEDECTENWRKPEEMRMTWNVLELLNERPVATTIACSILVGLSVAATFGSGSGATTPPGGPATVYGLIPCTGGEPIYTRQDLSSFVGRTLDLGTGFFTVFAETDSGQVTSRVLYGADYPDCDAVPISDGCPPRLDLTGSDEPEALWFSRYENGSWSCVGGILVDVGNFPKDTWVLSDSGDGFDAVYYQRPPGVQPSKPSSAPEDLEFETF